MIDLKNFDPKKDFENFLKPYGEKALAEYRTKFSQDLQKLLKKHKAFLKDLSNFKQQLITIAGGTISIFIALQGNNNISFLTKFGFASLGLSLVLGTISLFFELDSKQHSLNLKEDAFLLQQKLSLDILAKSYPVPVDIKTEQRMLSLYEKTRNEFDEYFEKRQARIDKILRLLHLDGQRIENGQILLFMIGIVLIVLGLFF